MGDILPPPHVVRMEQFVGFMTQGFMEELPVKVLNGFVFMGLALLLDRAIIPVEGLGPEGPDFVRRGDGLPAPGNAAPGTAHNLDEGVVGLPCLNKFQEPAGIAQAMSHGNLHLPQGTDLDGGLLDSGEAADGGNVQIGQVLPRHHGIDGAQGRLHDTTPWPQRSSPPPYILPWGHRARHRED